MKDIKSYETFTKIEPIHRGVSKDKKYYAETTSGKKIFIRITNKEHRRKEKEFKTLQIMAEMGIPVMEPVEFGTCEDGTYMILSWIDGKHLSDVLYVLFETEQYLLGIKAGEILRKIHAIRAPDSQEIWSVSFTAKIERKVFKEYHESNLALPGVDKIFTYFEQNKYLLENRPQSFLHGDYGIGNIMLEKGELKIIDFDGYGFGDPWKDFVKILYSVERSSAFATGQIDGYFGGVPPKDFWPLLALYMSIESVNLALWQYKNYPDQVESCLKLVDNSLRWFSNMENTVPTWYQAERMKELELIKLQTVKEKLKESEEKLIEAEKKIHQSEEKLIEAEKKIHQLETSTSWRITKPLRVIVDKARGKDV